MTEIEQGHEFEDETPRDVEAEKVVLGGVLESRAFRAVAHLRRDDFYRPAHGTIFAVAQDMDADGEHITTITMHETLQRRGLLSKIGGAGYLHDLMAANDPVTIARCVQIVEKRAEQRRVYESAQALRRIALGGGDDIGERARSALDDSLRRPAVGGDGVELGDLLARRLREHREPVAAGVTLGWPDLDRGLAGGNGLQPGALCVVAARPSVGKSLVGQTIALGASRRGYRTLLSSLEMSGGEIADRVLADVAGVGLDYIQGRHLNDVEAERVDSAADRLATVPMRVDDSPGMTVARIRAIARDLMRHEPPLGLIVVDYLQLLLPSDDKVSRQEQVSAMSRGLKRIAKEFKVPVVALAQLNREIEKRAEKVPVLSDLRESGSVEQDSDVVLMLSRHDDRPGELDVHVAKNRSGPSNFRVTLAWHPALARVGSFTREETE